MSSRERKPSAKVADHQVPTPTFDLGKQRARMLASLLWTMETVAPQETSALYHNDALAQEILGFDPHRQISERKARAQNAGRALRPTVETDHAKIWQAFESVQAGNPRLSFTRRCQLVASRVVMRNGRHPTPRQVRNVIKSGSQR